MLTHSSSTENKISTTRRIVKIFGWTRSSYYLLSGFLLIIFLIGYVWWPLAEEYLSYIDWDGAWWMYIDWLLIGIFLFMSLLIMANADLRVDVMIVSVGLIGGLVIESWGTQTKIWTYYTAERFPLWTISAWPIASRSIDRLVRILRQYSTEVGPHVYRILYWLIFPTFYTILLFFVAPTFVKSFTIIALLICAIFILTPTDHRMAVLTIAAGAGLGYFLERWGTTRECWTYYTLQTLLLLALLAHGKAAVAFWRTALLMGAVAYKRFTQTNKIPPDG